jgi:broad specificity phosphatase PhoE
MTTLYLVRHGEVHNPTGIIYGRLPGFGLSVNGQKQLRRAADILAGHAPFAALYASPMQRAQESAQILASRLDLSAQTEEPLIETGIGGYQGKTFAELPKPYITEEPVHEGIECAASIRSRLLQWVEGMGQRHTDERFIAVSHRDPIIVALLHWQQQGLDELPGYAMDPGAVYQVSLSQDGAQVTPLS